MSKYTVILARRVDAQLLQHMNFLARVSLPAARRFRADFAEILGWIEENPYQFPLEQDVNLPEGLYRSALFSRCYKALFSVEGETVYLDAVVDCRQSIQPLGG